ncbi:MAG: hypothetical protein ABFS28_04620 [Bacteroidota bacterium]
MKKYVTRITRFGGIALLVAGALFYAGCEGPAGPPGPAGADGQDGIDGVDGTDGTDGVAGNSVCLTCHTAEIKDALTADWAASLHGTSQTFYPGSPTTVQYAGGRVGCAKCHSHEGFIQTVWTGLDTTAAEIPLPQPVRCKTCHGFHTSLDFENEANSAIRQVMSVTLMADETQTVEFENEESNLCMHCHQSRRNPADDADGTAMVFVSPHYGPHHGPQANLLNGLGGYEFGSDLSASGAHASGSDCISCHMHEDGAETGGHTWVAGIEGCTSCHADATDFDVNGAVTEIEGLLHDLEEALKTAGMLDADGHAIEGVSYQADSVGALWNYLLLEEDASSGIHNPAYAKALLNNSISLFN